MIGGTLGRYIGLRFLSATLAIFVGILALTALIDFVEQMRRASDVAGVTPGSDRANLVVSRAAARRAPAAVLRPDRDDVVLSQPVAPQRTCCNARRRYFGVAVRGAGRVPRFPARACRHPRLQSDLCNPSGAIQAAGERALPRQSDHARHQHRRVLDRTEQQRRQGDHQCARDPRPGRVADRRNDLQV